MKLRLAAISLFAACAVIAFGACGDDGDDGGATSTPERTPTTGATAQPSPSPQSSPTPGGAGPTGVASVDDAIAARLAGDFEAVEGMFEFQSVACEVDVMGAGGPPECEADEADGTLVDVLPVAQCEGAFLREQDVFFAQRLRGHAVQFVSMFNAPDDIYPEGDYAVIFGYTRPEMPDKTLALELMMDPAGVTGVNFGCGESPQELIAAQGLTNGVVGDGPVPGAPR
jgi:hypothetical protein